jgi:hypothetical protein
MLTDKLFWCSFVLYNNRNIQWHIHVFFTFEGKWHIKNASYCCRHLVGRVLRVGVVESNVHRTRSVKFNKTFKQIYFKWNKYKMMYFVLKIKSEGYQRWLLFSCMQYFCRIVLVLYLNTAFVFVANTISMSHLYKTEVDERQKNFDILCVLPPS